jgi:hypothetical protein
LTLRRLLPPPGARFLVLSDLANTIATGLFTTGGTIFLVRTAGLSVAEIGTGLTIGGVAGLAVSVPLGRLSDRIGPRDLAIGLLLVRAGGTASLVLVHSFPLFVALAVVVLVGDRGADTAIVTLVARAGGPDRVTIRAYLRAVTNVGVAVGALLAGVFIAIDSRPGYVALMLLTGATLAAGATLLLAVPRPARVPVPAGARRWTALRDRPYLAVTALHGVLSLNYDVLAFAIPLWVVKRTTAPHWIVAVLMLVNTVLVASFQVRASRGTEHASRAAAVGRRAGLALLVSYALVAASSRPSVAVAVALLLAGVAVQSVGELWQTASAFGLSLELAQEHAQGEYQGVFALGRGVERALAPAVLSALCLGWGPPGWLVVGGVLAAAGALLPAAARAAERDGVRAARLAKASP